jgi:hypothetical protein
MSNNERQSRLRRVRDWFKKPTPPVEETPSYDLGGGEPQPEEEPTRRSRWQKWREDRRKYVIERKKAQAGIAEHRKWVLMWVAVIVVAVVVLILVVMNKFSIMGLIF